MQDLWAHFYEIKVIFKQFRKLYELMAFFNKLNEIFPNEK